MTATEKAINELKKYTSGKKNTEKTEISVLVLNRVISALEQESCDDCISRQAVLNLINADWKYESLESDVKNLPPVTPQPKTGHWIHFANSDDCSGCGWSTGKYISPSDYCPKCGARMVEPAESEE